MALIDVNELLENIEENIGGGSFYTGAKLVIEMIKDAPTKPHCGECIHFIGIPELTGVCGCKKNYVPGVTLYVKGNDYCSNGERKPEPEVKAGDCVKYTYHDESPMKLSGYGTLVDVNGELFIRTSCGVLIKQSDYHTCPCPREA